MSHNHQPVPKYVFDPAELEPAVAARPPEQYEFGQVCVVDGMRFEAGAASLPNPLHPGHNEDEFLIARSGRNGLPVYAVLDAISSPPGSERAAYIGRQVLRKEFTDVGTVMEPHVAEAVMAEALHHTNEAIWAYGRSTRRNLGTTVVVVRPFRTPAGIWNLVVGYAGDSRAVQFAADYNSITQMTLDHTVIPAWTVNKQYRFAQARYATDLGPGEEEEFHERHGIYAALGGRVLQRTIRVCPLVPGKTVVLSTDGVHDPLTYNEMADILAHQQDPYENAYVLVSQAQRVLQREIKNDGVVFRGKDDDATSLVFRAVRR